MTPYTIFFKPVRFRDFSLLFYIPSPTILPTIMNTKEWRKNILHKCLSLLWCTETTTTSACVKIMILSSWLHLSWFWDLKKYLNATKQLCDKNTSATVKLRVFVFRSIFLFCHFVFWHNLLFVCFLFSISRISSDIKWYFNKRVFSNHGSYKSYSGCSYLC